MSASLVASISGGSPALGAAEAVNSGAAVAEAETLGAAVAVVGTATFVAGSGNNITLDTAGNNFSAVVITSANDVTLVDTNAIDLGASTISGALSVTASGACTVGLPFQCGGVSDGFDVDIRTLGPGTCDLEARTEDSWGHDGVDRISFRVR